MNQNDILAQQQALLNQIAERSQHVMWGVLAIQLAFFVLSAWVVYMFYARLRDIADELRNFRISYDFFHSAESKVRRNPRPEAPRPTDDDSRFKPKT
jgi:hypothetical protein